MKGVTNMSRLIGLINNKFMWALYILIAYVCTTFILYKVRDYILSIDFGSDFVGHLFGSFNSFLEILLLIFFLMMSIGAIIIIIEIFEK
ncbi:hypothetical protein [Staphylococcus succinus]|uniref:hypothetical protein n=1 Tax=Staphylococcus succinus TaxID=61015 RepID=UPI003F55D43A